MRKLLLALMMVASIPVFATPTGLIMIPSTDVQPTGVWHLGVDSYSNMKGDEGGSSIDANVTYGPLSKLEVGVDVLSNVDSPLWFNAKYQLLSPSKYPVPVAVGIMNVGTTSSTNQAVIYGVASATLSNKKECGKVCWHVIPESLCGTRFTAGGYTGREEALGGDDSGVMLGIDRCIGKYWVGADYMSGDNALGSWNLGVGYNISDNVSVLVGYDNYNSDALADTLNFQFDWNL